MSYLTSQRLVIQYLPLPSLLWLPAVFLDYEEKYM
jgi:hypothetical protein